MKIISTEDLSSVSFLGTLGIYLPAGPPVIKINPESLEFNWKDSVFLTVKHSLLDGGHRYNVQWEVCQNAVGTLKDSIFLENAHWYGCAQVKKQLWPIEQWKMPLSGYVTGNSFKDKEYGGVQERYWLSSRGIGVFVETDIPLFVSLNNKGDQKLTFVSKWSSPYNNVTNQILQLKYSIFQGTNVKDTHMLLVNSVFCKPTNIPDELMFRYPVWSTWAKYKKDINEEIVIKFAEEIRKNHFTVAQIEIDDDWTPAYGDMDFDTKKFPNAKAMVEKLKDMGYRTTLWVHPFASPFSKASDLSDFWVHTGIMPGYTTWWNGIAKILDMTNEKAVEWYKYNLGVLRNKYGITSYKFDAGEANWLPNMVRTKKQLPSLNDYSILYAQMAADVDTNVRCQEVRVGFRTQELPIFVRMMDKDSKWDYNNGLQTLIPHALTFSLLGYPFILPDMIGGNAYKSLPDRELFIRWLETNVFLPCMQFSITPWQYDQDVIDISHKMTQLHEEYADLMIELAHNCVKTGEPIVRPVWWIAPYDAEALKIDSEFLVGNDILVAPVLEKGAIERDIYLPAGKWRDMINYEILDGGKWHKKFTAKLEDLPFFIKVNEVNGDVGTECEEATEAVEETPQVEEVNPPNENENVSTNTAEEPMHEEAKEDVIDSESKEIQEKDGDIETDAIQENENCSETVAQQSDEIQEIKSAQVEVHNSESEKAPTEEEKESEQVEVQNADSGKATTEDAMESEQDEVQKADNGEATVEGKNESEQDEVQKADNGEATVEGKNESEQDEVQKADNGEATVEGKKESEQDEVQKADNGEAIVEEEKESGQDELQDIDNGKVTTEEAMESEQDEVQNADSGKATTDEEKESEQDEVHEADNREDTVERGEFGQVEVQNDDNGEATAEGTKEAEHVEVQNANNEKATDKGDASEQVDGTKNQKPSLES